MPFGSRDDRVGRPSPPGAVEMPTLRIPNDCACVWTVCEPGPGLACKSRLTYPSALCPRSYEHERDRQASVKAAAEEPHWPGVA